MCRFPVGTAAPNGLPVVPHPNLKGVEVLPFRLGILRESFCDQSCIVLSPKSHGFGHCTWLKKLIPQLQASHV